MVSQRYHTIINFVVILVTSYMSYIAYFFISALYSFSKSQATAFNLIKNPQFYLAIFLISGIIFLYELARIYLRLNIIDDPINLIKKYRAVK